MSATTSPDPAVIAALAAVSQEELAKYMAGFGSEDAKSAPKSAKGKTAAKVAKVRNLDPETISAGDYLVVVIPTSGSGQLWRGGSRVQVKGKAKMALRSLDAGALSALVENHDAILAAMESVDKRALLGSFLPADESTTAAVAS